jgi:hypothetical protein
MYFLVISTQPFFGSIPLKISTRQSDCGALLDDLTPETFLSACIEENKKRMSKFYPQLMQPQLMPRLANIALRTLQLLPKGKSSRIESPNLG